MTASPIRASRTRCRPCRTAWLRTTRETVHRRPRSAHGQDLAAARRSIPARSTTSPRWTPGRRPMPEDLAALVLLAAVALALLVTSRWDAEPSDSYARYAACQAGAACRRSQ